MSYILGYDPETLREQVNLQDCSNRLEEIGEQRSLPALLERVWLLKVLGRLDDALVISEQAVRVGRMAGTRKDLLRARVLHATVLQQRGAYAAALQELTTCAEEAEGQELGSARGIRLSAPREGLVRRRRLRLGTHGFQTRTVPPPGLGRHRRAVGSDPARHRSGGPSPRLGQRRQLTPR